MRKIAPALVMTATLALAASTAFANDSMNKGSASSPTDNRAFASTATTTDLSVDKNVDGKKRLKQSARNDAKCDASKMPAGTPLPKDCLEKSGTAAAAVNSTQGQSGGSSQ